MQSPVLDRFLRYVGYDTQSREGADAYPSTPGQLILLRDLLSELQTLGLPDATMDDHGYVTATIPPTSTKPGVPAVGFIAHVDTSPEMSGAGVRPIVHRGYDGRDTSCCQTTLRRCCVSSTPPTSGSASDTTS
jgi:tripeptide aminopeptidase